MSKQGSAGESLGGANTRPAIRVYGPTDLGHPREETILYSRKTRGGGYHTRQALKDENRGGK